MRGKARWALGATVVIVAVAVWQSVLAQEISPRRDSKRLVVLKADGLPPELLEALSFPERPELMDRLDYAADLRRQLEFYRRQTGRRIVLPNIRRYFFENGVHLENIFSETVTLSAAAWAVIDTGQPSVIKGHATFSRDTCYLRSHLDGLRDTLDAIRRGESKTAALWNLDQVGVSPMRDAFDPWRVFQGPQIYSRSGHREFLGRTGIRWLTNDEDGFSDIFRSHLSRLVTSIDYTEFNQEMTGEMMARKVLERNITGEERYDYITGLFTLMDHQQHVDPHPENLIHWLTKLDRGVGRIFSAIERSERRDNTVVTLVSDHGSEIKPGQTAFSFPITRHFRKPIFGAHTIKTLLVESAWNAASVVIPGIDFPRVYESRYSPYGEAAQGPGGESGYVTAFIDNFGNGRSSVNLRNDDLNRLHLLLLELRKQPIPAQRFTRLRDLFRETLEQTRTWLEPDLALYEDYRAGSLDLAANLARKADNFSQDSSIRLIQEASRDAPQIKALQRLLSIRFEASDPGEGPLFDELFSKPFRIPDFIPKQFLGLANTFHQLSNYTMGLDEDLNWVRSTVDAQGRSVEMNYFDVLSDYRAPNAPANGRFNPFDLMIAKLPSASVEEALGARGLLAPQRKVKNAVWARSTAKDNPEKGDEALIVQDAQGLLQYIPLRRLEQDPEGAIRFELGEAKDPLRLLASTYFRSLSRQDALDWMRAFHSRNEWLEAAFDSEYGTAICTLIDILNNPVPDLVASPEFRRYLVDFSDAEMKERYLRGLNRKYSTLNPDFVVWSEELWNFNSKARTSGGSHSGLRPIVSNTAFLIWGGPDTRVARGRSVAQLGTTLDIVPTLFRAVDMLDDNKSVIRRPGSIPERIFHPFPGQVLDIWQSQPIRADAEEDDGTSH